MCVTHEIFRRKRILNRIFVLLFSNKNVMFINLKTKTGNLFELHLRGVGRTTIIITHFWGWWILNQRKKIRKISVLFEIQDSIARLRLFKDLLEFLAMCMEYIVYTTYIIPRQQSWEWIESPCVFPHFFFKKKAGIFVVSLLTINIQQSFVSNFNIWSACSARTHFLSDFFLRSIQILLLFAVVCRSNLSRHSFLLQR